MIVIRDTGLRQDLGTLTPGLRAFARALVDDHLAEVADEMVQGVLLAALNAGADRRGMKLRIFLLSGVLSANRRLLRDATLDQQEAARNRTVRQGAISTSRGEIQRRPRHHEPTLLDDMPLECRETLLLVVLEGLSYVQAAECLGVPLNTVIGNLSRAREQLGRKAPGAVPSRSAAPGRAVSYLRVVK